MLRIASMRRAGSVALGLLTIFCLLAQEFEITAQNRSRANSVARRNAEIARMLAEIDARNIERTIRKLVSFGTRNTLSAQDNPTRGIGAARDWLYAEFQKIAAQSGGRMTVEKQSYEQAKAARVPEPTIITNV